MLPVAMEPLRVAINGLGRIGRLALRHAVARATQPGWAGATRGGRALEIVGINDLTPIDDLAYLLNHDSVHGGARFAARVNGEFLEIGPFRARVCAVADPGDTPWRALAVDLVLECTGRLTKRPKLERHLAAGAPRVVVSAPAETDRTIVVGVNEHALQRDDRLVSCASCTTNAIAPVLAVLHGAFTVRWALAGTVHAYTAGQGLVDGAAPKDRRRGRAAALNIVPTSTGAGSAIALVLPELAGKIDASSVRVPVANGSLFEVTCTLDGSVDLARALEALRSAAATEGLRGVLDVRDDQIVSADVIGDTHSTIVDVGACLASGPLLKIAGWYDNEAGYAARLLDLATLLGAL
jgi:glyceraldehyde 3-phosphate dehydrogenase